MTCDQCGKVLTHDSIDVITEYVTATKKIDEIDVVCEHCDAYVGGLDKYLELIREEAFV